ncbi:hypothetical protein K438DRAFT_1594782, partial [Mycena galopus ATCC 62051]
MAAPESSATELLDAFRSHFQRFQTLVTDVVQNPTDAVVIARLGDDLDEFADLVQQYSGIFEALELSTIQTSLVAMQGDIRSEYREALDASHNGWPVVIQRVATGRAGRPRIDIDPDFLRWAYYQRSTASIHRFLGVCRNTVRSALLRHGITSPQSNPFPAQPDLAGQHPPITSYTGPLSGLSDDELDNLLLRLRSHFRRLIRWRIVIHGFIDGYSRLITGLRASDNNRADTVLDIFLA